MEPITVKYLVDRSEKWGLWVDTVSRDTTVEAVVLPRGPGNPKPITIDLSRIDVIASQNTDLSLGEPQV